MLINVVHLRNCMEKGQLHERNAPNAPKWKPRHGLPKKTYARAMGASIAGRRAKGHHAPSNADALEAQGATEYLILLAVVLIIALVSVALLGFFPGVSYEARVAQSDAYWSGEAQPIQIVEHVVSSGGYYTFVVRNVNSQGTLTINTFTAGPASVPINTPISFGEQKTLSFCVAGVGFPCTSPGNPGEIYELPVAINYTTQYGIRSSQVGAKKLIGKYT